ncbi:hypothetical protein C6I20_08160 [Aeromicrobium sp. A1-2]|uniref:hypothetical protein n=1 Tax=Aeromicrobium sp. A1-2 TaxID=2107713 RepID=UPI000E4B1DC5|nr:hypothetical protein [Aeromicrobium sp. A1-2]AXT85161.1 hypothetical protein C6I20_08160 [Aeromicrobium sp. A1-2]
MKGRPSGYEWTVRGKEVVISHHGTEAAVLSGPQAHQFVREAEKGDAQLLMARVAGGTYKAPGERRTGPKPRPRGR